MGIKNKLAEIKFIKSYLLGRRILHNPVYAECEAKCKAERAKTPSRTTIINYLVASLNRETTYLEIGVRNPDDNFNHIQADTKYSVDPGVEFKANPVDFKMTSDVFFANLDEGAVLTKDLKFDVIFIDGLHLADQVDRDIQNALRFIKPDGFVVLHDCNPPTEWHARETYHYSGTPARGHWNGTTWKAFMKWRSAQEVHSCCIDTDWGIGILSKEQAIGAAIQTTNFFFEYHQLDQNRKNLLNLITFNEFKSRIEIPAKMNKEEPELVPSL